NYCKPGPKSSQDYVLSKGKDTLFVNLLQFSRGGGNVNYIGYVDGSGKVAEIKGSDCDNVIAFRQNCFVYELLPLKDKKQEGYQRHFWKQLDGKIDLYNYNSMQQGMSFTTIRQQFRLPDGKVFEVDKKSMQTY